MSVKKRHLNTPALLLSGMLAIPASAAEKTDTIVVTATRTPQAVSKSLASVTVITRKDIERSNAPGLVEILRLKSGIDIARTGGPGSATSVFIRGSESDHVLVIIDGVRAPSSTTGIAAWGQIPLSQIERIEIVRGPRATLYGSDAVGGVIQITTRKGKGISASTSLGSFGTRSMTAGISGGKRTRYSLNAEINRSTGFSATNSKNFSFNADKDGFFTRNFSASLGNPLGDNGHLELRALFADNSTEFDSGKTDTINSNLSMKLTHQTRDNWNQTFILGHVIDKSRTYSSFPSKIVTRRVSTDWQNDITLGKGSTLTAGLSWYRDKGSNINPTTLTSVFNDRSSTSAVYANWLKSLGTHDIQLGLRHDNHSEFGSKSTGQLGWGHDIRKGLRLWGAVGTAFKAPNLNELYHPGFGGFFAGNPNLQPETSRNIEAGFKYRISKTSRLNVTTFYNSIDNLINYSGTNSQAINVKKSTIRGIELEYSFRVSDWNLATTATFQQARDKTTGKALLRRPDRKFSLTAVRNYSNGTDVQLEWLLVGERPDTSNTTLGGYGLVNLSASYRLNKQTHLAFRIENLFDKQYETANGYNTPDRSILVTLRYNR